CFFSLLSMIPALPRTTLFPYTTLFRSGDAHRPFAQGNPERATNREHSARLVRVGRPDGEPPLARGHRRQHLCGAGELSARDWLRSEEHTSELQSRSDPVCRLLLEKKKS